MDWFLFARCLGDKDASEIEMLEEFHTWSVPFLLYLFLTPTLLDNRLSFICLLTKLMFLSNAFCAIFA